jgi:RNA recognition motif-containing protein
MGSKIYVGNLSSETTEADLQALFSKSGTIESLTLTPGQNYAYIEMSTPEETIAAINNTKGQRLNGLPLNVSELRVKSTPQRPESSTPRGKSRPKSRSRGRR